MDTFEVTCSSTDRAQAFGACGMGLNPITCDSYSQGKPQRNSHALLVENLWILLWVHVSVRIRFFQPKVENRPTARSTVCKTVSSKTTGK